MPVFVLLFLTSAMLAVSGAVKLKATARAGLSPSVFAIGELGFAVLVMLFGMPGPFSGSPLLRWSVPVAFMLIVASSVHHGVRLGAYRRHREATEGGRLATFLKYAQESDETE